MRLDILLLTLNLLMSLEVISQIIKLYAAKKAINKFKGFF